jgi:hypothetical protein
VASERSRSLVAPAGPVCRLSLPVGLFVMALSSWRPSLSGHVKVVIEQFEQRSFKLREIIEFGLRAGKLLLNSSSERICAAQTSQK